MEFAKELSIRLDLQKGDVFRSLRGKVKNDPGVAPLHDADADDLCVSPADRPIHGEGIGHEAI
jgi:hypothetical protein